MSVLSLNSMPSAACVMGSVPPGFELPAEMVSLLKTQNGDSRLNANLDQLMKWLNLPLAPESRMGSTRPGLLPRFDEVGKDIKAGDRYGLNGKGKALGRISRNRYAESFKHPVALKGGNFLFQGKLYSSWDKLAADMKDGTVDGRQTSYAPWAPPTQPGVPQTPGTSNGSPTQSSIGNPPAGAPGSSFLDDPSLSLEDKLMMLMALLAQKYDSDINKQMRTVKDLTDKNGASGANGVPPTGAADVTNAGSAANSTTGSNGAADKGSPSAANGSDSGSDLQMAQMKLQQLMERRNQMFTMISNLLKSLNDTSNAIIANLRA